MIAGPTLPDIRAGLIAAATPSTVTALHAQAFRAWLLNDYAHCEELAARAFANLRNGTVRAAADVATLGYVSAAGRLRTEFETTLGEELAWLGDRTWFRPHQPLTLEADGVAAFGVALALDRHLELPKVWLQKLVVRSGTLPSLASLDRSLFVAAAHLLVAPGRQDAAAISPEVRLALGSPRLGEVGDSCYGAAWQGILHFSGGPEIVPEAALLLRALDAVTERNLPARLGRLDSRDVLHVLEGVQRSFRRWSWEDTPRTRKSAAAHWDIENEYHVQNILWAVLAPLFPDLNDEETLAPVGQKNPRVDLSIPSVSTIVEVKFVREGTPFQSVIEEIAADASLYGTDPRWQSLIPFVWDDARRTEDHPKLLAGLRLLRTVIGAVVVSRPGRMARAADTKVGPGDLTLSR